MSDIVWCGGFDGAPACCNSCHEDHEQFDMDLMDIELTDGRTAIVCCAVGNWLEELIARGAAIPMRKDVP